MSRWLYVLIIVSIVLVTPREVSARGMVNKFIQLALGNHLDKYLPEFDAIVCVVPLFVMITTIARGFGGPFWHWGWLFGHIPLLLQDV